MTDENINVLKKDREYMDSLERYVTFSSQYHVLMCRQQDLLTKLKSKWNDHNELMVQRRLSDDPNNVDQISTKIDSIKKEASELFKNRISILSEISEISIKKNSAERTMIERMEILFKKV